MKRLLVSALFFLSTVFSFAETPTDYHIGVVTGTVSQSEDGVRGAENLIKLYGDASKKGKIVHVTYPDNFMQEMETTISQITGLANDPKMKAIVVVEAIPGTVEAFRKVREKRPDILLFANAPHEDPAMIADVSDLVTQKDSIARGYLIIKAAQKMGAKKFMHISFPRHMSYQLMSRRREIMKETCKELGMEFIDMSVPDPLSDVGIAGAQQYILEQVPTWIKKYGKDTAFFATNDAQTEPLLKKIAEDGGIFVEPDSPSPTMGYPGALGIKFDETEKGNWKKILEKVESEVISAGGKGRMGTWTYSYNFASAGALAEFAREVIEKGVEVDDLDALKRVFANSTPGAKWNGRAYVEPKGQEIDNYIMLYQDTYVFGKGYLGMTEEKIPKKYMK